MKLIKNRCLWLAALLGALLCLPLPMEAQTEEEPMMVIKTRVYEASGGAGSITSCSEPRKRDISTWTAAMER